MGKKQMRNEATMINEIHFQEIKFNEITKKEQKRIFLKKTRNLRCFSEQTSTQYKNNDRKHINIE